MLQNEEKSPPNIKTPTTLSARKEPGWETGRDNLKQHSFEKWLSSDSHLKLFFLPEYAPQMYLCYSLNE